MNNKMTMAFMTVFMSLGLSAQEVELKSSEHHHPEHNMSNTYLKNKNSEIKSGSHEHTDGGELSEFIGMEEYFQISGIVGLYSQTMDDQDANVDRDEFANLYGSLHLETVEWEGFRLGLTGLFNSELHDHNDNYGEYYNQKKAILSEAFIKYNYEETEFTLGRQGVDWLMLGDYFEGVFVESEAIENFLIRAAWVQKGAVLDPDEVIDYTELNDDDGVYGTEITFTGIHNLAITGLYYHAPDAYDIFGAEIYLENEINENFSNAFLVQYFATDEKESFDDYPGGDGSIFHINNTVSYRSLSVGAGYIEADEDAGAGNMLNNPWDPFDEDTHTDRPNAKTWYIQAEYEVTEDFTLMTIYGESDTDEGNGDAKFKEFDLGFAYQVRKDVMLEATYVHVTTTDDADEGFDKLWLNVTYEF
jgi:hypothetical protein